MNPTYTSCGFVGLIAIALPDRATPIGGVTSTQLPAAPALVDFITFTGWLPMASATATQISLASLGLIATSKI